ncbi:MAG: hypothetical protein ACYC1E_12595 [Propionibacteriaceae bacterium]
MRVFVSHYSGDGPYVEAFVDEILRGGCQLGPHEIFCSSMDGLGIAAGQDLMAAVRQELVSASHIISLITPMYASRPVCMAESGAAWARQGEVTFLPMLARSVSRDSLNGSIFAPLLTTYSDEERALNELHDRLSSGRQTINASQIWSHSLRKWMNQVGALTAALKPAPSQDSSPQLVNAGDWVFLFKDGQLFSRRHQGEWLAWRRMEIPQGTIEDIAAASHGGAVDLFLIVDGMLYQSWWNEENDWTQWYSLNRPATKPIACGSMRGNHAEILNFTPDGALMAEWLEESEWQGVWEFGLPN